jgi:tRNA pseudouridine55 synthase
VAVHGRNPDALLGTARIVAGELIPERLLTPVEIAQTLNQGAQYFST